MFVHMKQLSYEVAGLLSGNINDFVDECYERNMKYL